MKRIILITGGQRSGKSTYAEKMALDLSQEQKCVYMATARIWDGEFAKRVDLHKQRRGERWINVEEEKYLSKHNIAGKVVLVDCMTLWSTNFFYDISTARQPVDEPEGSDKNLVKRSLSAITEEFDKFTTQDATFIFVTNEIGLSGVSENKLQRQFTDLLGWLNQYVASKADDVYFMISGIPLKIK